MTTRKSNPNRRHAQLVEPGVQLGVALRLVVLWTLTTLMTALVTVVMEFFANPTSGLLTHLFELRAWAPSLIALAVTLPIALLHLIRFSHRFAGPVHRLRNELRALAAGEDRPALKFRKGDFWTELADDFNAVAARLRDAPQPEPVHEPSAIGSVEQAVAGGKP